MICEFCQKEQTSGHYSVNTLAWSKDGIKHDAWEALRGMFPDGEANGMNFVLFSTSGVHGDYGTIEDVEASLRKYGNSPSFLEDKQIKTPDDWNGYILTVSVIQPRLCSIRYTGNLRVTLGDIEYLKRLRQSSWDAVQKIGRP